MHVQANSEEEEVSKAGSLIAGRGKYIHTAAVSIFFKSLRMGTSKTKLWGLPRTCLRWVLMSI